ncbi:chitin binding protein, partial [Staphylotrichum tortipilum]
MPAGQDNTRDCKPEICVADCNRKAKCDPGGYGPAYAKERFVRPSCAVNENSRFGRVIGYYEVWSLRRICNKLYPEQIPAGIYTHLNFAFVGIHPETFEVVPDSQWDEDTYKRLANLKLKDRSLKVFITVGGWDFNNLGPTATTFSDLAASLPAQRAFARSPLRFMATYNFDGVDIDWEYPGAPDRFGREADYINFPIFIENLRVALHYLQYFDIKKLAASVDFFNLMTYDLHGVPARDPDPSTFHLNAHTNLTEIRPALDLFWRNGISPDKVTLGVAFHGRGFTARSHSCLELGCPFDSGANALRCSREVGLAMNSEIDELIRVRRVKETLDEAAAVKILTWDGDQWMAYDDGETLRRKADFAHSQCLGGVAVWAVTHDTREGKYSRLLGGVARRRYDAFVRGADEYDEVAEYEDYCRWTGCNE